MQAKNVSLTPLSQRSKCKHAKYINRVDLDKEKLGLAPTPQSNGVDMHSSINVLDIDAQPNRVQVL